MLSVGRHCTTQASVILEGTFCCVSLETFSKGFPCSMSLAVPAAITRAGDPKHLSQVQALGQQPLCTAAAGPRMGSRSRGTAVLGLRTPETNDATQHPGPRTSLVQGFRLGLQKAGVGGRTQGWLERGPWCHSGQADCGPGLQPSSPGGWPCLSHVLAARLACQGGSLATGLAKASMGGWPGYGDCLGLEA